MKLDHSNPLLWQRIAHVQQIRAQRAARLREWRDTAGGIGRPCLAAFVLAGLVSFLITGGLAKLVAILGRLAQS